MFAFVRPQVDGGDRALEQLGDAGGQAGRGPSQREDRAIMGGVGLDVEDPQARYGAQRLGQAADDVQTTPFADVGNTFDGRHDDDQL